MLKIVFFVVFLEISGQFTHFTTLWTFMFEGFILLCSSLGKISEINCDFCCCLFLFIISALSFLPFRMAFLYTWSLTSNDWMNFVQHWCAHKIHSISFRIYISTPVVPAKAEMETQYIFRNKIRSQTRLHSVSPSVLSGKNLVMMTAIYNKNFGITRKRKSNKQILTLRLTLHHHMFSYILQPE